MALTLDFAAILAEMYIPKISLYKKHVFVSFWENAGVRPPTLPTTCVPNLVFIYLNAFYL